MKKLLALIPVFAFVLSLCAGSGVSEAMPLPQVDKITLGGPTYQDDQWTLTLTSPVSRSVTYITTLADVTGCNICNVTKNWGEAINNDVVIGALLTAEYVVWDGFSPYDPIITLVANAPGIQFSASVSVIEASDSDFNETEPLSVTIETVRPSQVPAPATLGLFAFALTALAALRLRTAS